MWELSTFWSWGCGCRLFNLHTRLFEFSPVSTRYLYNSSLWFVVVVVVFISRHLDFFEIQRNEDELLLSRRFDVVSLSSFIPNKGIRRFKVDHKHLGLNSFRSMWRPRVPARCLSRSRRTWSTQKRTPTCSLRCSTASWCPVSSIPLSHSHSAGVGGADRCLSLCRQAEQHPAAVLGAAGPDPPAARSADGQRWKPWCRPTGGL